MENYLLQIQYVDSTFSEIYKKKQQLFCEFSLK